jgi:hypothetical protein
MTLALLGLGVLAFFLAPGPLWLPSRMLVIAGLVVVVSVISFGCWFITVVVRQIRRGWRR